MPSKVNSKIVKKKTVAKRAPKSKPVKVAKPIKVNVSTPVKVETEQTCPVVEEKVDVKVRSDVSKGDFQVPPISSKKSLEKDELVAWFDNYLAIIEHEIELTKESKNRDVSIQVFKNLLKYGKKLKATSVKVMKTPRKNTSSGFQKEKEITKEMAKFAGWKEDEFKSRNDIYKALIKYIKENDLQNPENRREIRVDQKLSKLLSYDAKKRPALTFSSLQSEIGKLFKQ